MGRKTVTKIQENSEKKVTKILTENSEKKVTKIQKTVGRK